MRKLALAISAFILSFSASAQSLGVVGGFTSPEASFRRLNSGMLDRYHVGFTACYPITSSLSFQPEILYNKKSVGQIENSSTSARSEMTVGYLEFGAQLQFDLWRGRTRLYGFMEPFVGYGVNNTIKSENKEVKNEWSVFKKPEGGFALGAGFQFNENLQLSAKYFWNLGNLYDSEGRIDIADATSELVNDIVSWFQDGNCFNGLSLSMTVYF